jgi:hypothetical protein
MGRKAESMTFAIPPKPSSFTPQGVAPGCRRIPNLYPRVKMGRRVDILCVHTNWAQGEGSIESAVNWSLSAPGVRTYAHYQHDRDGDAAKMLDSDRRGIGTGGKAWYWDQFDLPTASWRSLTFETADRGLRTDPDPEGSYFSDAQLASLTRDLAYECVVHDIPPVLLPHPTGRGIVGHCHPFPYPVFTTASGKQCPGHRKYRQLVDVVIPWTAAIVAAWTATTPPPAPAPAPPPAPLPDLEVPPDMWLIVKTTDGAHYAAKSIRAGALHIPSEVPAEYVFADGGGYAFDLGSFAVVEASAWSGVKARITKAQAFNYMGAEI